MPRTVVGPQGQVVYTGRDVSLGQQVFLHNGLMEYGSAFGHGAYLGPDFTADYLRRSSILVRDAYGGSRSDSAARRTIEDLRTNRYDERSGTLRLTAPQVAAFERLVAHYGRFFSDPTTRHGLRPKAITDPQRLRRLTAFFAWTAWAASTNRPGHSYSYTNNWPPEPRVDNTPTANVLVVWSVLSLIALLGGIGLLFGAFGRWGGKLGWHGREQATLSFRAPGDVALTPARRATAWFFFVMAALFVVQTLVGAASQHYRSDITSFFGFDLAQVFPYNLMRTWHVQLALFWVATSFVAAGIFLAPMIAGREPHHQGRMAFALLGALTVVVLGTLVGSYLGIHGVLQDAASNWFGLQGFEYLDLARLWQVLLSIGLFFWVYMLWRVLRRRLKTEHPGNMPWLFFLAACAIPAFYAVSIGFWNFLGAGVFGFLINLPIVSYYEIGTALTANHGHAAMMGVYGMLALGLALFCLRYLIPDDRWPEKWARISFWATNIGLAWMCFATLLPPGILQLYESVNHGYFEARELKFLGNSTNTLLEWMRLPGDVLFIAGGAIPTLYIAYLGIRHTVRRTTLEEPDDILFTEIAQTADMAHVDPAEATAARLR